MKFALLYFVLSAGAEAGALIRCGEEQAGEIFFELRETADDYVFEFIETIPESKTGKSFLREITHHSVKEGHRYSMSFRASKEFSLNNQAPKPTCRFEGPGKALFSCYSQNPSPDLEIRDLSVGTKEVLRLVAFRINNIETSETKVTGWQELSAETRFELSSFIQTPTPKSTQLPIGVCRSVR
jgi:hypothetical protein